MNERALEREPPCAGCSKAMLAITTKPNMPDVFTIQVYD